MVRVVMFVVVSLLAGACGTSATTVESEQIVPEAQLLPPVDAATVAVVAPRASLPHAAATDTKGHESCRIEWRTASTAVEAYFAQNGIDATTLADLVPDYLREPYVDWDLQTVPAAPPIVVAIGDGACAGFDPAAPAPVDPSANPVSVIGIPCSIQATVLQVASDAFFVETGARPVSQNELLDRELLAHEFDLYDYAPDSTVVPRFEGACELRAADFEAPFSEADPTCFVDFVRVSFGGAVFERLTGNELGSSDVLVERGYFADPLRHYSIRPGDELVVTDPATCPDPVADDRERACAVERRTIETAIEAHWAEQGVAPVDIDDLVPDYLREIPARWSVVYSDEAGSLTVGDPLAGSGCA